MQVGPSTDKRAGPSPHALVQTSLGSGLDQTIVGREAQIVVRCKIDERLSVGFNRRTLPAQRLRTLPKQVILLQLLQLVVYPAKRFHAPMIAKQQQIRRGNEFEADCV